MIPTATARTPDTAQSLNDQTKGVNRREFLQYVWGASLALLLTESCGAITWFALPHYNNLSELGFKTVELNKVPAVGTEPILFPTAKYWLSNTEKGLLALSELCVKDLRYFRWVPTNNRFECPACGSHYNADGTKRPGEGPAMRSLDRFEIRVTTAHGTFTTPPDGSPVDIKGATQIVVNVNHKILGKPSGEYQQHIVYPFWY